MTARKPTIVGGARGLRRALPLGHWPVQWPLDLDRRSFLGQSAALVGAALLPAEALAAPLHYDLKAVQIAPDTYAVYGTRDYFSRANGGNIVNVAFVVTDDGVVVIDTGSSLLYGQTLKALVEATAKRPVARVYLTHHHPDHIFGSQAFDPATIATLPEVSANMKADGEMFAENMYRLVGDWMRGTELVAPGKALEESSERFGSHEFELIRMAGHTSSDLVILDKTTGVLFAGDIAFLDRAPTTPHADLDLWHKSLNQLENSSFTMLMPGHGPAEKGKRAVEQTNDYLNWLERTLKDAVHEGLTMNEAMAAPIPERLRGVALARDELGRSVAHLYAKYEEPFLPVVGDHS